MSQEGEAPETPATLAATLSATRRFFDGKSKRARETERRILESMRGTKRMPRVFWLVPLAAAFVVSAAFADEVGGRLAELASDWFSDTDGAAVAPSSSGSAATHGASAPRPTPSAAPAPAEPLPTEPVAPLSRRPTVAPPASAVATARSFPSASTAASQAASELAIYKNAHRAHFVDLDYANALTGWERYLAVAPRGTFALEARYNRAIALYRLGRREAALEALRPFADGAYGAYRRDEARVLMEELR